MSLMQTAWCLVVSPARWPISCAARTSPSILYYHHSGYAGGLKETKYRKLIAEKPEFAVRHAIVGMLPKGPLGRQMASKLRIYAGPEHEQAAQKPEKLELIK